MSITSFRAKDVMLRSRNEVVDNVLVGAAVCLTRLACQDAAAAFVLAGEQASLLNEPAIAASLARVFALSGRWRDGSDFALARIRRDPFDLLAEFLRGALLLGVGPLNAPAEDASYVSQRFVDSARVLEEAGGQWAGAAWYSVGNYLFHTVRDYPAALEAYEGAARTRPDYLNQPYYLAEKAAALFEIGRYEDAAAAYDQARRAGSDATVLAKRADCLAHAGDLSGALDLFLKYEDDAQDGGEGCWLLKRAALEYIEIQESIELAASIDANSEVLPVLHPALGVDRWSRSTFSSSPEEGDPKAIVQYLTVLSAFPAEDCEPPWPILLAMSHVAEDRWTFDAAVDAGWKQRGSEFGRWVFDSFGESPDDTFTESFTSSLEKARIRHAHAPVMRLLDEEGNRTLLSASE